MATPYLLLNTDAASEAKYNLAAVNSNTTKIENALYRRRADLPDRTQIGSDWFSIAPTQNDWEVYTGDLVGNKVVRHGRWAMVEIQFKAKRAITIPSSGNPTSNAHIITLVKGYRPLARLCIDSVNSYVNMVLELHPNGNGHIVAYNNNSTTIAKDTVIRVAGRYVYVP